MKWTLISIALIVVGAFVPIQGRRVIGFRTATTYDNRATDFPRSVVAIAGRQLTLDDGSTFLVREVPEDSIVAQIDACERRVRVDQRTGTLFTPRPVGFCSFDFPQRLHVVTIPLVRLRFRQFSEREFAEVRRVDGNGRADRPGTGRL